MSCIERTAAGYGVRASKKRANVTLNEDLFRVAQTDTDNLSGTTETLLAALAQAERRNQEEDREHRRKVVAAWNAFDERYGRFADEWSRDLMPDDESR